MIKNPYEYEYGYQRKYDEYGYQQSRYELYNPGPKFETEAEAENYCKNQANLRNIFLGLAGLTSAAVGLCGVPGYVGTHFLLFSHTLEMLRRTSSDGELFRRCVNQSLVDPNRKLRR